MKASYKNKASVMIGTIKGSLAMVIPVLFIGSITVTLNGFPVQAWQDFMDSFLGGALRNLVLIVQKATVGVLAVYITIALGISYMKQRDNGKRLVLWFGNILGCVTGFFILLGFFSGDPDLSLLSGQGVFSAMVAGLLGSFLFAKFEALFVRQKMVFVDGADSEFNAAIHVILPFLCVTMIFAAANHLITVCFGVESVQHLFMKAMEMIFSRMHRSFASGLLFVSLTSIMWWFGIHGNNVLNQVAEDMFAAIIPGQIVSKSFIDTFVNMGGTGCMIGLLIAMIVFGKRNSTKKLSGMAAVPEVFNIGEMLVFGFPVIYNPALLIPFVMSPVICFTSAYLFTLTGFVPAVTKEVVWTTPALMSGYIATGSVRGIILQLVNILISVGCYAPFVIRNEKKSLKLYLTEMKEITEKVKNRGERFEEQALIEQEGDIGKLAIHLAVELEVSLSKSGRDAKEDSENPLTVKYKPVYDGEQRTGAEALLKWEHSRYGTVYPPLVIEIARESGNLYELETFVIERAIGDSEEMRKTFGERFVLYVYSTASTFCDRRFAPFLQRMADSCRLKAGNVCIRITEADPEDEDDIRDVADRIEVYGFICEKEEQGPGAPEAEHLGQEHSARAVDRDEFIGR